MLFTRIRLRLRSFVKAETTREGRECVRRIRPVLEELEDRVLPSGIDVTEATDDGTGKPGTLSAAIITSNANPGQTIVFDLNNTQTVTVTGQLPAITAPVAISGNFQGILGIELKGPGAGEAGFNGLTVNSGGGSS